MIIKKIKIKKKSVEVICDKNISFDISLETYMNNSILINEEINEKEIKRLISQDDINNIKIELMNKLSRKRLSKNECINFLSSSNFNDNVVFKIVSDLEKAGFINDRDLAESIVINSLVNKKGKELIKEELHRRLVRGDYQEYINEFLNVDRYNQNIEYLINKYMNMGRDKTGNVLKQYIVNKMVTKGYKLEEFQTKIVLEEKNEIEILTSEINKFFKVRERNDKNMAKITKKLLSKGFNYGIIKCAIEEWMKNETN